MCDLQSILTVCQIDNFKSFCEILILSVLRHQVYVLQKVSENYMGKELPCPHKSWWLKIEGGGGAWGLNGIVLTQFRMRGNLDTFFSNLFLVRVERATFQRFFPVASETCKPYQSPNHLFFTSFYHGVRAHDAASFHNSRCKSKSYFSYHTFESPISEHGI